MHLPYPPYISYSVTSWPWYTPIWSLSRYLHRRPARQMRRAADKLHTAGVSQVGLLQPESHFLELELMDNEHIKALVQGRHEACRVILAATNRRVIIAGCQPRFIKSRQLEYSAIEGVNLTQNRLFAELLLHTPIGDLKIEEVKPEAARRFRDYIVRRCLTNGVVKEVRRDHTAAKRFV